MRSIEPAPHEFAANLVFADLGPFFAADKRVKEGQGSQRAEFVLDGDRWRATLYYQDSGLAHPGDRLPSGTEWRLEEMREYRLAIQRHPEEDPVGEQKLNAHIAPRWQGMDSTGDGSGPSVPDDLTEGVNVRVSGANIAFDRYVRLLRRGADAVGINPDHFRGMTYHSNVFDAERYVRVHRDASGPVHARTGPIAELGHLLESDREGYRKVVQNDDDEHGRNLPGYYHTVTLGPRRVREAFPSHATAKEVKHYYAREAESHDPDHPLAHPKVGVSLQAARGTVKVCLRPEHVEQTDGPAITVEQLRDELDATLRAVLAEAGLNMAPGDTGRGRGDCGPYVADAYFAAEVTTGWDEPVSLDLSHIRQEQESVVVRHLADGLSPVQWESLETLVADGGEVSPAEIADENGRHVGSVRRALREMDDLVERERARVNLASEHVARLVHDAVQEARDATRRAAEATAKAVEAADRGLGETMSAVVAWAARHGVDVSDARDGRMTLRMGDHKSHREAARLLREGFRVWTDAGLDATEYREARVEFADGSVGEAWRWLATT